MLEVAKTAKSCSKRQKLPSTIGIGLHAANGHFSVKLLIDVYDALVQPHFNYCSVVWGNCGRGLSEKLQKLQNRAARILMCANYDTNIDELFRALGWRKLKYQRLESAAIMMYKSLHGMTPENLSSRFISRNDVTPHRLRNTENKLALPQPRTNYLKKSFSYSGAGLWTAYLVTFVQQHLYIILNLINVTTVLNEF